jgi:3-hydroxybutyryl-CoA dehydrogenase
VTVLGIVGAGVMGAGIAQVALENGWEVVMHDVDPDAIDRARERIRDDLGRRAAGLDLDADSIEDWVDGRLAGLRHSHTLDGLASEASLITEAALEDLALKQSIFRALDAEAPRDTILATNTSALSVTTIAEAATSHADRVVGLHFFNPVPLMRLVEVVAGARTSDGVVQRATEIVRSWGKTPVRSADSPGFIVNRVNRPFTLEALRLVEAGRATVDEIDRAVESAGYPMGPFRLMDLVGIDVNFAVAKSLYEAFDRAERFKPSDIQESMVEAGSLGRKSGGGFYRYDGHGASLGPNLDSHGREANLMDDRLTDEEIVRRIEFSIIN